eukprot:m.142889 g.142889  ORF g.142889 m.142889 type:complete len:90 (+) comp52626_c0_seq3:331-600(+)
MPCACPPWTHALELLCPVFGSVRRFSARIPRFTPTSAGPNSFGKTKVGFTNPLTRKLQWTDASKNPNARFAIEDTTHQQPQQPPAEETQ